MINWIKAREYPGQRATVALLFDRFDAAPQPPFLVIFDDREQTMGMVESASESSLLAFAREIGAEVR